MTGAAHLRLDEEKVGARLCSQLSVMPCRCGRGRDRRDGSLGLDSRDERGDEIVADRLLISLRKDMAGGLARVGSRNALDDGAGVLVAGVQALEVDECQAAVTAHADGEFGIGDRVHGGREKRDLEPEAAEVDGDIHLRGIGRHGAGDERNLLEAVGSAETSLGRVADRCLIDQRDLLMRLSMEYTIRPSWTAGISTTRSLNSCSHRHPP